MVRLTAHTQLSLESCWKFVILLSDSLNLIDSLHGRAKRLAHFEEHDSQREHIHFLIVARARIRLQFRGYIKGSADASSHVDATVTGRSQWPLRTAIVSSSCQAEITNLDVIAGIQKQAGHCQHVQGR